MNTPEALVERIDAWIADDSPPQHPIRWDTERWLPSAKKYPHVAQHADFIQGLPNGIGRADVAALGAVAARSPEDAMQAFIASMVWGFGRTGYAVFRTNRILEKNPDAAVKLQRVAEVLADDGPVEGYRALANEQYLKWFGPAFGTKYLAFCSRPDNPALILDALVATWLNEHCGTALRPTRWSTDRYEEYLTDMAAWSAGHCTPTELETLVFVAEASRREGNQWAPSTGRRP
jgi:hypothetical protein